MHQETTAEKVGIAIMFIAFLAFWAWIPDFTLTEAECAKQSQHAITTGLCSETIAK